MEKFSKVLQVIKKNGIHNTLSIVKEKYFNTSLKNHKSYQDLFKGKIGIEIGGPSDMFNNKIPIYSKIKALDGVNFSSSTVWEGELQEGKSYQYGKGMLGNQFICDAVNLEDIESDKYDFVLSCNNLEHIANPFKALSEWLRVTKIGGLILLVLPNKTSNFDHNRKITAIEHLLDDFKNNTSEEDLSHLDEILELHDLSLDPAAGNFKSFRDRSIKNFENRCLHHHVYDMNLLEKIFKYFNIKVLVQNTTRTDFIIVGEKM